MEPDTRGGSRTEPMFSRVKSTVVLFTLAFPFGNGEQFLEAELAVLASYFDRIVLVPTDVRGVGGPVRDVPSNTIVLGVTRKGRLATAIRQAALHPLQTAQALLGALRARTNVGGKVQELRFRMTARTRANETWRQLVAAVDDRSSAVFYAYWLDLPAAIAIDVRSRAPKFVDVPIIARAHGFDVYTERRASNYLAQRDYILGGVSRVYSVSRAGRDYIQHRWPDYREKVSIAPLGTAVAINPRNAAQSAMRLVSCSFVVPVKRLELLIDALAEIRSRGRQVHWSHIGPVDTPYANEVRQRAEKILDASTFKFVGELDSVGVRTWYARNPASAFINVSASEGVPVSIMEGLAQGLPILATDVGGNSETFDLSMGMFDGLLPAEATAGEIADRIETLLDSDPCVYRGYVDASFAHWKRMWSSDANYAAFASGLLKVSHQSERIVADDE